jgi:hypothetical protein
VLWAVLVPIAVWFGLRRERARTRVAAVLLVAAITVPASGALGIFPPAMELWNDSQVRTLVYSPACFPFTIISVHDFDARLFNYRIVLGWPNGIPLVVFPTEDDQSEFMHIQALTCAVILTQLAFVAAVTTVLGITAVEVALTRRKRFTPPKPAADTPRVAKISFLQSSSPKPSDVKTREKPV